MSPDQTHGMGKIFIEDFINAALHFHKDYGTENIRKNKEIFSETKIDIETFLQADDITVETEKIINNPDSRIDIFIQSKKTETTIIIENKVFTSTHDDQLNRYEKEAAAFYGKKVFIYLTPNGDIPTDDNGKYQKNWCALSYEAVIKCLKERTKNIPKTKNNAKLIFLLEDYIKMVDTNILRNNANVRAKCKEIRKKYAKALELLMNYTDNVDEIYSFVFNWINENVPNIAKIYFYEKALCFYTKPFEDFFAKYNRRIVINESWYAFEVQVGSKDGPINLSMGVGKPTEEEWGEPEIKIKNLLTPDKKMPLKYCTLFRVTLLQSEERQLNFADVQDKLIAGLTTFFTQFKYLEEKIISEL